MSWMNLIPTNGASLGGGNAILSAAAGQGREGREVSRRCGCLFAAGCRAEHGQPLDVATSQAYYKSSTEICRVAEGPPFSPEPRAESRQNPPILYRLVDIDHIHGSFKDRP